MKFFNDLEKGYLAAYKAVKKGLADVGTFLANNGAEVQAGIKLAEKEVTLLVPASAPFVSAFSAVEEPVMAKLMAFAADENNHATGQVIFGDLWGAILSAKDSLSSHPYVVAALPPAPAPGAAKN